jgi:hypothetical protein
MTISPAQERPGLTDHVVRRQETARSRIPEIASFVVMRVSLERERDPER